MKIQRKGAETQRAQRMKNNRFAFSASPLLCVRFYDTVIHSLIHIVGRACFFAHADMKSPRGHKLRAHPTGSY